MRNPIGDGIWLPPNPNDERGIDASVQTDLMLQKETICCNEYESKQMQDKINAFERSLTSADTEKPSLRQALEEAENMCTKSELTRKSLDGDLKRIKLLMADKERQNQELQDRVEVQNNQIEELDSNVQSLQLTIHRLSSTLAKTVDDGHQQKVQVQSLNMCLSNNNVALNQLQEHIQQLQRGLTSSEHNRSLLQEKLVSTTQGLNEAQNQNYGLHQHVQMLQKANSENDFRRAIAEGQLSQIQSVEREKRSLEQSLACLQKINKDSQKKVKKLQAQLDDAEQQHAQRLIDVTTRHRAEIEMETERHQKALMEAAKTRERTTKTKIKELEETNSKRKDQLAIKVKKSEQYISHSARTSNEISQNYYRLNSSLHKAIKDKMFSETETRELDELKFRDSYRSNAKIKTSPIQFQGKHAESKAMRNQNKYLGRSFTSEDCEKQMETTYVDKLEDDKLKLRQFREEPEKGCIGEKMAHKETEIQNSKLKDKLAIEVKKSEQYIPHSARTSNEISQNYYRLDSSLPKNSIPDSLFICNMPLCKDARKISFCLDIVR